MFFNWRAVIEISQGDTVYHPRHGIGSVLSFRERTFSQTQSPVTFAKLYFERDGLTVMMPKSDLVDTVRDPINKKQAKELLKHIEEWEGDVSSDWKRRNAQNEERLETGEPTEIACVYKSLCLFQHNGGRLTLSDRKQLQRSLDLLTEEIAVALDKSEEEAQALIFDRCEVDVEPA